MSAWLIGFEAGRAGSVGRMDMFPYIDNWEKYLEWERFWNGWDEGILFELGE